MRGVNASRRATQLQVFNSIFNAINGLENEFVTLREKGEKPSERWCYEFFNTVEYMAFLLNHNLIRSDDLVGFYANSVRSWYGTFCSTTDRKHMDDPEFYREFKRLYRSVKNDGNT
jgi:hypothetical protein